MAGGEWGRGEGVVGGEGDGGERGGVVKGVGGVRGVWEGLDRAWWDGVVVSLMAEVG